MTVASHARASWPDPRPAASPPSPSSLSGSANPVWSALEDGRIRARLQSVTRRIAESGPDAEDAFQDAVVQALVHADRFRSDSLVSTWLHRIFVNSALMGRRRSAVWTRRTVRLGYDLGQGSPVHGDDGDRSPLARAGGSPELRDVGPSPEDLLAELEQRERLRAAIACLPIRTRRTVEAFLRDESRTAAAGPDDAASSTHDRASASEQLESPVTSNAIRARLSRARARLRELVGGMEMSAMPRAV
jgi:RNA polymerase sigma factor (sigma-70 family)